MSKTEGFDGDFGSDGVWRFRDERDLPIQHDDERDASMSLKLNGVRVTAKEEV